LKVFSIVDDPEEATRIILKFRDSAIPIGLQLPGGSKSG
jgi:hypothetical protein